jgi:cobalt/nickel transport system permease protein
MHIHFLDPYHPLESPIHALDVRVKFILTIGFVVACSLTPSAAWPAYVLLLAIILSVEILSGLGIGYVVRRSALALPFALAAFPVIFTTTGTELFRFEIGGLSLAVTLKGLELFASIVLKSWLSVQAAILLAASSPFPDLLKAMRAVHVPKLLVAMFGLMWRYLFVLMDEAIRLIRARAARSGESANPGVRSGGSVLWRAKSTGGMAGNLLLRAFERSERIYAAMLARGYDGEIRGVPVPALAPRAWLILILGLVLFVLLWLLGQSFGR